MRVASFTSRDTSRPTSSPHLKTSQWIRWLYMENTGCLLNIVFFLKNMWFFWTLQVLLQRQRRWPAIVYTHWYRGKTERGQSPEYILKSLKKHNILWTPCKIAYYFINRLFLFLFWTGQKPMMIYIYDDNRYDIWI